MQDHLENTGARELSDAELMHARGGNIFGDAWNAVKDAASDVVHTVTNAVTHPLDTLGTIGSALGKLIHQIKIPPTDSPPPWKQPPRF